MAFDATVLGSNGTSWVTMVLRAEFILLFIMWCCSMVAVHKGTSGALTLTTKWLFLACADCKKAIEREADLEDFTIS